MECPAVKCEALQKLYSWVPSRLANGLPKIIHQTWKTKDVPAHWLPSHHAWATLHPTWLYILWTDADIECYIKTLRPAAWSTFQKLPHMIQRVDLFRYFVLHDFGGIYSDLDIVPLRAVDSEIDAPGDVFLTKSANTQVHFTNALMASTAREPAKTFWRSMIQYVDTWPHSWHDKVMASIRHLEIMTSTGPWALTRVADSSNIPVTVLPNHIWNPYELGVAGSLDEQTKEGALIQILQGSSWHDADSKAISFMHTYKHSFMALILLLVLYTFLQKMTLQESLRLLMVSVKRVLKKKQVIPAAAAGLERSLSKVDLD